MKIIRDDQAATWTMIPVEPEEEEVFASIIPQLKPGKKIRYCGRSDDGEKFTKIHFYVGGRSEWESTTTGNVTVNREVDKDGTSLSVIGSTEADKYEIGAVRDTCFFASSGLIFLGTVELDGKTGLMFTAERCKHCSAPMIQMGRCDWGTCQSCAEKCEHNYIRGLVHGGSVDMGMGEFCDKCGMGKPRDEGEREKSVLEHHLAVERELGIHVHYMNGPPCTPKGVVTARRVVRKHERAQRRKED